MQQSPSWETNRFSASQEIPRILWNPNFHFRHKDQLIQNIKFQILKDVVLWVGYINNKEDKISGREIQDLSIRLLFYVTCKK